MAEQDTEREECDECRGNGFYLINGKPQMCICIGEEWPEGYELERTINNGDGPFTLTADLQRKHHTKESALAEALRHRDAVRKEQGR